MTRSTVVLLSRSDLESETNKTRMTDFTTSIEYIISNYLHSTSKLIEFTSDNPYTHIFEGDNKIEEIECSTPNNSPYHDDFVIDSFVHSTDKILGMKLALPRGGEQLEGRIINCKRESSCNLIGTEHSNPTQDTREYNDDFGDGDYGSYTANTIIENLHAQVDDYCQISSFVQGIISFRIAEDAVSKSRRVDNPSLRIKKTISYN